MTGVMRSIASRIVCGPTEQLSPMTSAPNRSRLRAISSGGTPYGRPPIDPDRHLRDDRHAGVDVACCENGLLHLIEIRERLDDEAVGAAFGQRLHLLAKHRARLVAARGAVGLDADAERSDGARDEAVVTGGFARQLRPRAD